MALSRRASHSANFTALLALAFACLRCRSDAADSGPNSSAGSTAHAGAHAAAGAPADGGAGTGGGDEGGASGAADGAQAGASSGAAGQGGSAEQPADIPTFNGCTSTDYEDRSAPGAARIIEIAAQGLSFTPPCLLIQVGQTVRFEGSLSSHPLAPGNPDHPDAGSADSPIHETNSGQSVEFTFPNSGTFPYYCEL